MSVIAKLEGERLAEARALHRRSRDAAQAVGRADLDVARAEAQLTPLVERRARARAASEHEDAALRALVERVAREAGVQLRPGTMVLFDEATGELTVQ